MNYLKNSGLCRGVCFTFVLFLLSCLYSPSSKAYVLDLQGGFRLDVPFGDEGVGGDDFAILPLDLEVYRQIIPGLHLGLGYLLSYHSEDKLTVLWHQFNFESTYRFLRIQKKFHLYAKLEIGLFSSISCKIDGETVDTDGLKIAQPNFRTGPGMRFKILKNLAVYTEILFNYYTMKSKSMSVDMESYSVSEGEQKTSSKSLMFTGGVFYTI